MPSEEIDYRTLLEAIYAPFANDVRKVVGIVIGHCNAIRATGMTTDNSTSEQDCALLYLLARFFERKHVFEIGTYIGTTALAMNEAMKKTGGVVTTSDVIDYRQLSPWSGIRFVPFGARVALHILEEEERKLDFVFFDWKPDVRAFELLNALCIQDAILAAHDCLPGMKGEEIVAELNKSYTNIQTGKWFFPEHGPSVLADGFDINYCTAFFVPNSLLARIERSDASNPPAEQ